MPEDRSDISAKPLTNLVDWRPRARGPQLRAMVNLVRKSMLGLHDFMFFNSTVRYRMGVVKLPSALDYDVLV